jgi:tRNA pseudouridine55 synthase
MNFFNGEVLAFDKPYGVTSFKVVYKVRNTLTARMDGRKIKVGHAGTLDPLATGVLLVCTGKATKKIEELQMLDKEYEATLRLGATTASFDMEHPEDATFPVEHITRELVENTLHKFEGDILQTPPVFSACKIDGKHAYHLARRGKEVKLQPKPIRIHAIELLEYSMPNIRIRVHCGKGTYIRALARDIGQELGSGAYLTALRRTRIGNFQADTSLDPEKIGEWLDTVELEIPDITAAPTSTANKQKPDDTI